MQYEEELIGDDMTFGGFGFKFCPTCREGDALLPEWNDGAVATCPKCKTISAITCQLLTEMAEC